MTTVSLPKPHRAGLACALGAVGLWLSACTASEVGTTAGAVSSARSGPGRAGALAGDGSAAPGSAAPRASTTSATPHRTRSTVATRTPAAPATPATPATPSVPARPAREIPGPCPYISDQDVANIEGNRVGRSTVVTTTPPGCRFYFQYADLHMTAQITIRRFPSALAAYNQVARTGGARAFSAPHVGDAAVLYQTRFYGPDGDQDWACTFARRGLVVTVNTDQTDPSTNARNLAAAVAGRL